MIRLSVMWTVFPFWSIAVLLGELADLEHLVQGTDARLGVDLQLPPAALEDSAQPSTTSSARDGFFVSLRGKWRVIS